jgi:solute:Na+ symporter, SSS family
MHLEYITLGAYFVLLIIIGAVFARFNNNLSDFVRGGARGTWWMVGTSMLMAGISAFTFTGNASAIYEAGPSAVIIYVANITGFIMGATFLGRWWRQSRAYTSGDLVRSRFGLAAEQTFVVTGIVMNPLTAAIQLWALAVFVSAVFGLSVVWMIVIIGVITLAYSTTGGMWGVMATDVIQGVIMYGMTLIMGVLCIMEVGGVGAFIDNYQQMVAEGSFTFVKEAGQFTNDRYTGLWMLMAFVMQIIAQIHLGASNKYLASKDGKVASQASWFCMVLMAVGVAVWFIPPMVARFLYADEVMATAVTDPATTSYAVAAANVLPNGLLGVMIAAMFSATMSSMDWGLNTTTGILVNNFILPLRRWLKKAALSDVFQIRLCRSITVFLGILIISMSIGLSQQNRFAMFDSYMILASVLSVPLTLPLVVGIFVRKMPGWYYFVMLGGGMVMSIYTMVDERLNGNVWVLQERSFLVIVGALIALAVAWPWRHKRSPQDAEREAQLWERVGTPVDFEKEVGGSLDGAQARIIGNLILVTAGLLAAFLLVPNTMGDRLVILILVAFVAACGGWLRFIEGRKQ